MDFKKLRSEYDAVISENSDLQETLKHNVGQLRYLHSKGYRLFVFHCSLTYRFVLHYIVLYLRFPANAVEGGI